MPQNPQTPPELTVAEYVLLGRTPHIGYLATETRADRLAAERAIARLALRPFAERTLGSLSGGELQRAVLARALAQEAPILLLDEPTSALDLGRQQQALELVDALRRDDELTVIAAMHDLSLAGQYADRLLLLDRGQLVAEGPAGEVLSEERIATYYSASVEVLHRNGSVFVLPQRRGGPVSALMVQGASSSAGKSLLTTALARALQPPRDRRRPLQGPEHVQQRARRRGRRDRHRPVPAGARGRASSRTCA